MIGRWVVGIVAAIVGALPAAGPQAVGGPRSGTEVGFYFTSNIYGELAPCG